MIVNGVLTGGQLASFAMYTMSVSGGFTSTMKVYARIMEVGIRQEYDFVLFDNLIKCNEW